MRAGDFVRVADGDFGGASLLDVPPTVEVVRVLLPTGLNGVTSRAAAVVDFVLTAADEVVDGCGRPPRDDVVRALGELATDDV